MPASYKSKHALSTPRSHFTVFTSLLRDMLTMDASFKANYLLEEITSKLIDPDFSESDEVRRTKAIDKWLDCEVTNRDTSIRLMHTDDEDVLLLSEETFPVTALEVIQKAAQFIRELLTDTIPWDDLKGSFSGGASTSVKRGPGAIARKYQLGTNITEAAIMPFLWLSSECLWTPRDFRLVQGNVMFTVPKSSSIDRCAAKEPELNMFVQKAIGDYIRSKLLHAGINLNDQRVNQRLARVGSIDGTLATIDLSSASDTITRQLVLMLLPDEWFHFLDAVRSPFTDIDGAPHENIMFSSMGNGYTFELESLIFWALARSASYFTRTHGRISVYGDDIICPSGLVPHLIDVLSFCGFKVNTKKSHFTGTFRESCGKHWDSGMDVTPFYIKSVPVNVVDWCHILNSLRKWSHVVGGVADPSYYELWELFASELVPRPLWGSRDVENKFQLVAPGRFPIAIATYRKIENERIERTYAYGAYLHWLDASSRRTDGCSTDLETSKFSSDGSLTISKYRESDRHREIPLYPQEIEG